MLRVHFQVRTSILHRHRRAPVLGHGDEQSTDTILRSVHDVQDHTEVLVGSEAKFITFFTLTCLCLSMHSFHLPSQLRQPLVMI